jgi:hypothetical protein
VRHHVYAVDSRLGEGGLRFEEYLELSVYMYQIDADEMKHQQVSVRPDWGGDVVANSSFSDVSFWCLWD